MTRINPSIVDVGRAVEAVFQRVMGNAGTGKLLVRTRVDPVTGVPGPNVMLYPGRFAIPIVDGAEAEAGAVYVKRNPATYIEPSNGYSGSGGAYEITAAGTLVNVESVQGGTQVNRVAGALYRWDESIDGIEEMSELAVDIVGGDFSAGRILRLRQLRTMKSADQVSLLTGKIGAFPALVLAWAGTRPADGPMQTSPGMRTARASGTAMLYKTMWRLFVVTSSLTSDAHRMRDGQVIVSDILEILQDAQTARELRVSSSPGIDILDVQPWESNARVYVDIIDFATKTALRRRSEDEVFSPWLTTRYVNEQGDQARAPAIKLPDEKFGMPDDGV